MKSFFRFCFAALYDTTFFDALGYTPQQRIARQAISGTLSVVVALLMVPPSYALFGQAHADEGFALWFGLFLLVFITACLLVEADQNTLVRPPHRP